MHYLTRIQQKIILDLFNQKGETVSLFKLAQRIESNYESALTGVNELEKVGVVETERSRGVGMRLRLSSGAKSSLFETIWGKRLDTCQTTNDKRQGGDGD